MYMDSGLGLRQDLGAWQGCSQHDPRFFLRREKHPPYVLSDVLLGNAQDELAVALIAEFLFATGGLDKGADLHLKAIGSIKDPHEEIVERFDRLVRVVSSALSQLGFQKTNAMLTLNFESWDVTIQMSDDLGLPE
jgi:hypothetical protein